MNKFIIVFTTLLIFIYSDTHAQMPVNGLSAHWPFTGNANDASPNGNHGNINNVTLVAGKQNLPNTAYLFNSSTSFIGVPYDASLNMGSEITMCAVFKPTAFYQGNCQGNYLFARGQQGTTGSYEMHFTDNPYNSCAQHDTNSYVMGTNTGNNLPSTQSVWQSPAKIHTGTWYCVVATVSGGTLKVYVNGALAHTSNGWNIGSSTDSICIGKYPWIGPSAPYNFTGLIDDIAIYNRALSTAEIDSYCVNAPKISVPVDTGDTNVTVREINDIANSVRLYPNPNTGSFSITGTLNSASADLTIYNTVGTVIRKSSVSVQNTVINENIDIGTLPAGMYLLKINSENYTENLRFVKQE